MKWQPSSMLLAGLSLGAGVTALLTGASVPQAAASGWWAAAGGMLCSACGWAMAALLEWEARR